MNSAIYDNLPTNIKVVLSTFNEDVDPYKECIRIEKKLNKLDYWIEYGLDGQITEIEPVVTVIFREFKNGDVIALFPYELTNYCCASYMHLGQHSLADYNHVISTTTPATNFEGLKNELESIGYKLKVRQRISYKKFMKAVQAHR